MSEQKIAIEQHLIKNFWQGRGDKQPLAIVEQQMPASLEETRDIFDGKAARNGHTYKVSAHYGIAQDGRVWQFVRDEDTAWANGVLNQPDDNLEWLKQTANPNIVTLAIQYETDSQQQSLSEAQYEAALALHQQLLTRWHISADPQHIIGHDKLDRPNRQNSPGPNFPWSRLFQDLQKIQIAQQQAQTEQELDQYDQAMQAVDIPTEIVPTTPSKDAEVAPNVSEPEAALVQQEQFLYELDMPQTVEAQASETNSLYDLDLDEILARRHETQPALDEGELLELDQILAQASASELTHPAPPTSLAPSNPATLLGDDFGLPDWLKMDEEAESQELQALDTPQASQPQANVTSALDSTSNDATQSFSVQTNRENASTQALKLPDPSLTASYNTLTLSINSALAQPTPVAPPAHEIKTGTVSVELANVRKWPSFEDNTVLRTVEEGEQLHFDDETEGPALNGGTSWLHITQADGDGWIHATLIELNGARSGS